MRHTPSALLLVLCAGWLTACVAEAPDDTLAPPVEAVTDDAPTTGGAVVDPVTALAPPADYETIPGERDAAGSVELAPAPNAYARVLRRMSVKQLRKAIANATGGLVWRDDRGRDMLVVLEPTLGVPTYTDTTNEDLDASLVFQKFLGDGVRTICDEAITADVQSAPDERVLLRFAAPETTWETASEAERAGIDENLRYMKLRITGHHVAPESEEMSRLRWLFRSVTHATSDPTRGWRAVCVGLMSSPEFYLY